MNVVVRSDLPADQLIAAVRGAIRQADPTLVMENVRTIRRHRPQHPAARASQLAGHDVLRPGGAAHGDARHLRRGVVLRPAAHRGARHADGPRRRQPRSRGARPRRRPEALAGGHRGGIDRARRRRLAARAVPRGRQLRMAAVCGVHGVVALVAAAAAAVPAWRTTLLSPMVAIREQPPSVWRWTREGMRARRSRHSPGSRRGRQRIGRLAGGHADGLRRRRAQRRLVHRRTARRARQRVRRTARRIGRAARAARRLSR